MAELHFARYRRDERLTHYLFRFPAKFHSAAVRCLIDHYSRPEQRVLDPFCGSGTLLLEAQLEGRRPVGVDVDPVATLISRVKCAPLSPIVLDRAFVRLLEKIDAVRRSAETYESLMHEDLARPAVARLRRRFSIPNIPEIHHWFRAYVAIDLARLRLAILRSRFEPRVRDFFLACFASIIRNSSNADPVPVSGLEVTSHMRELDKQGRLIDPFLLFEQRVRRELKGMAQLWESATVSSARVVRGDATRLSRYFAAECFDSVITSPPYNTAVDYPRRHTLEMYWLRYVTKRQEHQELARHYLGRAPVRQSNRRLRTEFDSRYIENLCAHARSISAARERTVRHYCASMQLALKQIARVLKPRGRAVFVVGNSKWNGRRVRATKLLKELAAGVFSVEESLSYPSQNRYMSYERHNGADVNREYVLVLRKR